MVFYKLVEEEEVINTNPQYEAIRHIPPIKGKGTINVKPDINGGSPNGKSRDAQRGTPHASCPSSGRRAFLR
jgi:hypothetical protein